LDEDEAGMERKSRGEKGREGEERRNLRRMRGTKGVPRQLTLGRDATLLSSLIILACLYV